ncbi:hypothetical protein TanjilG_11869 [Lupinus angustifolius]|uniref:Uncharacterized protein n=1 Tax=Lupinus angustifolius TaxID=3871 RepID=A0A394DAQ4_LUPAN|nr:PREDICTED: uncharacterized protein LOC109338361 [Lupinus angustifolius]OIW20468.1 hypothetical protein TanjilG_11869 [Lupinus angustifolius]
MFSMQLLCFYKQPPQLFASLSPHSSLSGGIFKDRKKRLVINPFYSYSSCCRVHAVKEDSEKYEVDTDKAREALRELDKQLQSFSNKQVSSPKVRVSDVKLTEEQANVDTNKKLEISDSFLAYVAASLVLFTMFYNVLFYTVIKPSIDGS